MEAPGAGPPVGATDFELTVSVSKDARLAATVRDLARYAAQVVGCDQQAVDRFGRRVEEAVRDSMGGGTPTRRLPVTLRWRGRALEVEVDGRMLDLEPRC